ncbi:glycoside hydrolase family 88 protein [Cellulomonas flavigena]|uniref:glycoside hydrolase family 88 protein n=1 Tax=Cellulomonas flavigena TaxID=1711 RepID=UPI0002DB5760|nr:glycoside hydrolase family 88 protein [Cellulomonas flavigena]
MHQVRTAVAAVTVTLVAALAAAPTGSAAAAVPSVPTRAAVLQSARLAIDHFYVAGDGASTGATANAGWRWAPYFMAVEGLYRETGDATYRQWLTAWGERNAWTADAPASPTSNPDSRAAIQVFQDAAAAGLPVDLGPSDRLMAADLSLPPEQYWWVDAMFMGLPLWPRWAARTGNAAYAAKHAQLYDFLKYRGATTWRSGCTNTGLFDASEDLWWRDCMYVPRRDALGHKVFWARGNGWVMAAMARTLMALPATDPQAPEYRSMLQRMSARVAQLQGTDGMWRSSLLSPALHPAPETSATALFTYAMAYGIRTGLLDAPTYLPVVLEAWRGLTTIALQPSGFLSGCQSVGEAPGDPSTTSSIGYCVGAFGLAALEVAQLEGWLATDRFARTTAGGLGTADVGGVWTTAGSAADFSTDGTTARLRTPAGTTRTATLTGVSSRDNDVRATFGFARPTAGSLYAAVAARRVGSASYTGRAVVSGTGSVQAQVQRSGTTLAAATVSGLTFATNDRLHVRAQALGVSPTTVRVKVWKAGTAEPSTWRVSVTDATAGLQTAGSIGLSTYLGGSASPSSLVVTVDDLTARRGG